MKGRVAWRRKYLDPYVTHFFVRPNFTSAIFAQKLWVKVCQRILLETTSFDWTFHMFSGKAVMEL